MSFSTDLQDYKKAVQQLSDDRAALKTNLATYLGSKNKDPGVLLNTAMWLFMSGFFGQNHGGLSDSGGSFESVQEDKNLVASKASNLVSDLRNNVADLTSSYNAGNLQGVKDDLGNIEAVLDADKALPDDQQFLGKDVRDQMQGVVEFWKGDGTAQNPGVLSQFGPGQTYADLNDLKTKATTPGDTAATGLNTDMNNKNQDAGQIVSARASTLQIEISTIMNNMKQLMSAITGIQKEMKSANGYIAQKSGSS